MISISIILLEEVEVEHLWEIKMELLLQVGNLNIEMNSQGYI